MKDYNFYKQYSVEQWLDDRDFVLWLKSPNNPDYKVFTELMNNDTEIAEKMNKGAQILSEITIKEPTLGEEAVSQMWNTIQAKTKKHFSLPVWFRNFSVAASLLVLLSISLFWFLSKTENVSYTEFAQQVSVDTIENITFKLNNKPAITLSNRSEIVFSESNKILVRTAKGDEISMEEINLSNDELGWLAVPNGKRPSIVFADGSRVTVRPGSKIVFPSAFANDRREIFIEGEAFLEVAKNKLKPFIVKTAEMEVEVLGTSFDVQAYSHKNIQSVVLVTGRVKVSTTENRATEITPNQKFALNRNTNTEVVNQVDVNNYVSWKDGILNFESEKLSNVLNELSNYYGVRFNYDSSKLNEITLSGKLNLNDNIEDVMMVLATTANIDFETMKTEIKINVKP